MNKMIIALLMALLSSAAWGQQPFKQQKSQRVNLRLTRWKQYGESDRR